MELQTKRVDFIGNLKTQLSTMTADMEEIPYFDLGFLVKRYGGFTREDLKANARAKERADLERENYAEKDIEKILLGADKADFKPEKKDDGIEDDPLADL